MTNTNGRWSQNATLALLTALLGVESAGALKTAAPRSDPGIAEQVRENAALIRAIGEEQRELHYAIKTLSGSVASLAQAVHRLHEPE